MTPHQAMTSPLSFMDERELHQVISFCDLWLRQIVNPGPTMDKVERRMKEAQQELQRKAHP